MQLKILGSSSKGNGYLFDNGKEALLVECGVGFNEIKIALDFDISRLQGALVSHEHGDHARGMRDALKSGVTVYASGGTIDALNVGDNAFVRPLRTGEKHRIGGFSFQCFDVQHDAKEPCGFLIHHQEMGLVLFATDTYYLKYRFAGLSNILIECNYRLDILNENTEAGRIHPKQRERILKSHFEFENCKNALKANDLSKVNNIVLIHLSEGNSNAREFQEDIEKATGKSIHIAQKGMVLEFNKTPF